MNRTTLLTSTQSDNLLYLVISQRRIPLVVYNTLVVVSIFFIFLFFKWILPYIPQIWLQIDKYWALWMNSIFTMSPLLSPLLLPCLVSTICCSPYVWIIFSHKHTRFSTLSYLVLDLGSKKGQVIIVSLEGCLGVSLQESQEGLVCEFILSDLDMMPADDCEDVRSDRRL